MGKRSNNGKRDNSIPKKQKKIHSDGISHDSMVDDDDEIDAFYKQRDVVPLDINDDLGESDDDSEHPVFDYEDVKGSDGDGDEDDADDDDLYDDTELKGLAAKISRQQKYLRAKIGGVEDEMHDDAEEDEEKRAVWGRRKNIYYSADNIDYELQSSDEELPAEEEAEVLRLQKEKAKSLSMEDFGLEDVNQDESDGEPTIEEIVKGRGASKTAVDKEVHDDVVTEEVKKDLTALSREEQMDVVFNSAPELVGLLSELNDGLEQLENKVNPFLSKVVEGAETKKGEMNYCEVKQLLLLAYCQAITFYLLLKSEGQLVRDHPVIARLVEIKNLLDKMKQLDENLPSDIEEILKKPNETEKVGEHIKENASFASDSLMKDHNSYMASVETHKSAMPDKVDKFSSEDPLNNNVKKREKRKRQDDLVGLQSMEMLKKRAELEEKLKQKGVFSFIAVKHDKTQRNRQPVNGKLETLDDFDDDPLDLASSGNGISDGTANSFPSSKISQLAITQMKKSKVVSGDDDLPNRDDIGERRRKHELRVLAGAGIKSVEDVDDAYRSEGSEMEGSQDDLYEQVGHKRAAKLAAKAELYSRTSALDQPSPETVVDGKRQISYQIEKNRGLTRARKKLTKNPRKKYKLKHKKAIVHRKGQVRDIRKPSGPYGGEVSGINTGISRSIRFKN